MISESFSKEKKTISLMMVIINYLNFIIIQCIKAAKLIFLIDEEEEEDEAEENENESYQYLTVLLIIREIK